MSEAVDAPLVIVRAFAFGLAILAFGRACFQLYAPAWRRRSLALDVAAPAGFAVASAAYLALLAREVSGSAGPPPIGVVGQLVAATGFGRALAVSLAAGAALAIIGAVRPSAPWAAAALAGIALVALAFVGHGADGAGPGLALRLALMALHLLAVGAWLGALPCLRRALGERGPFAAVLLERFGLVGGVAVALVVASGLGTLGFILAGARWRLGQGYGAVLVLKLAFVAGLFALAAINRFRLTPMAASRPDEAARSLRRAIVVEQVLGLGAIASVALLGQLDPTM